MKTVVLNITFNIEDEDLLLELAAEAIEKYGRGHKFDPHDLGDCIIEVLLNSNPFILSYDQYGLELADHTSTT